MPDHSFSVSGKIALITGATRGIGRRIAQALIERGAEVWVHGQTPDCESDARAIGAQFLWADLARYDQIDRLISEALGRITRLDVLVNNAGCEQLMPLEHFNIDVLEHTLRVNAAAPTALLAGFMPLLKASGRASVINVTSIHERTAYPQNSAYCMSKAALAMLTRVASIELAPFGIRVNNLAPGAIETDINRQVIDRLGKERFAAWIPAGRVGSVDELVGPALFLASDASSYVTGATLYADGGYRENLIRYQLTS